MNRKYWSRNPDHIFLNYWQGASASGAVLSMKTSLAAAPTPTVRLFPNTGIYAPIPLSARLDKKLSSSLAWQITVYENLDVLVLTLKLCGTLTRIRRKLLSSPTFSCQCASFRVPLIYFSLWNYCSPHLKLYL